MLLLGLLDIFEALQNRKKLKLLLIASPKYFELKIWGVFKEANVSQMARILDLGCIFASDCIPNVLF